ncbi:MAG: family 43 glycosylhydrolase [Lachnospiraceae bacterium]|nr:family 43 glycosylhydrolase [Lachnospiraceae bacterium]
MAYLLSYTRLPIDNILYDPRLAYSMHLALSEDGKGYQALNHNSGVLFVKATDNEDGSVTPWSLVEPVMFATEDGYGVLAKRIGSEGDEDPESAGKRLYFTTKDFLEYTEVGFVTEAEAEKMLNGALKLPVPKAEELDILGAVPSHVIEIPEAVADRLRKKLITPVNCGVEFPAQVKVASPEELAQYKASSLFTDGTKVERKVDWDLSTVDFSTPGTYTVKGRIHQEHFEFPVAFNRADPCVGKWNGKYYFIATNDADGNHTLYIREADTLPELVDAEEILLLDSTTYEGIGGLLWAPEFHEIDGRWYIFHAATPGEFYWEESHVMALREGGNPVNRADWSAPKRVVKADGSDICEAGKEITLDMTVFDWEGEYYAIWSQRQFLPKDLGAWLYIAKINPKEPWKLASEPVVLLKPDYGWSNNHTFVVEGPFALPKEDILYITFSGAAVDTSYVVGLLSIPKGKDLLDPKNWKQGNYPILTARSVEGEYGTGHNAYVTDEEGTIWNTYHARPGVEGVRSSGIRRVHFDIDGAPMLDVTEELDLLEEYAWVETQVEVF